MSNVDRSVSSIHHYCICRTDVFFLFEYFLRHHNVQSLKRRFRIPSHGTSEKTAVHTKVELT